MSRKEWLLEKFQTIEGIRFWEPENHPIELWSNAVIDQKLEYIHQNPVEEGLVFRQRITFTAVLLIMPWKKECWI